MHSVDKILGQRTYIIAEAGVNHNGSLDMAMQLIDVAAQAGVNAIKFQTFKTESLVSAQAPKAGYQLLSTAKDESQFEMLKKLELSEEAHFTLLKYCQQKNIEFLSTPFDEPSLQFLVEALGLKLLKISSGEINNAPFLLKVAQSQLPIILSTGMSSLQDIELALSVLAFGYLDSIEQPSLKSFLTAYSSEEGQAILRAKVALLQCTTEYPAPVNMVNLRVINSLQTVFGVRVGFSDHTQGIHIPVAAVARGARIIEKHFTLDKNLPGPDHKASISPDELKMMVSQIREVEQALGSGHKYPFPIELENRIVARKSLTTLSVVRKGEIFTEENLTAKRPNTGISPFSYWDYLGRVATKDYNADEQLS